MTTTKIYNMRCCNCYCCYYYWVFLVAVVGLIVLLLLLLPHVIRMALFPFWQTRAILSLTETQREQERERDYTYACVRVCGVRIQMCVFCSRFGFGLRFLSLSLSSFFSVLLHFITRASVWNCRRILPKRIHYILHSLSSSLFSCRMIALTSVAHRFFSGCHTRRNKMIIKSNEFNKLERSQQKRDSGKKRWKKWCAQITHRVGIWLLMMMMFLIHCCFCGALDTHAFFSRKI